MDQIREDTHSITRKALDKAAPTATEVLVLPMFAVLGSDLVAGKEAATGLAQVLPMPLGKPGDTGGADVPSHEAILPIAVAHLVGADDLQLAWLFLALRLPIHFGLPQTGAQRAELARNGPNEGREWRSGTCAADSVVCLSSRGWQT